MTDATKTPRRWHRRHTTTNPATGELLVALQVGPIMPDNPAWRIKRPSPWPYKAEDSSVLAWWRKLPSDLFQDFERAALVTMLEQVSVLHADDDVAAALAGDPAVAVGVALSLLPIEEINLRADIAMTALLCCACNRDATAALVLAQVLGLTDLDHPFATELAASWYTHGLRYSANPRKFSEVEATLLAAFRERDKGG